MLSGQNHGVDGRAKHGQRAPRSRRRVTAVSRRMVELGKDEASQSSVGLTSARARPSTFRTSNRVYLMRRRLATLALFGSTVAVVYIAASCATPASASQPAAHLRATRRELDANQQIAQALSRLTFGARP